ncbi:MAG: hypothetical protein ACR2L2_04680 [Acidobacteriota bacterium]
MRTRSWVLCLLTVVVAAWAVAQPNPAPAPSEITSPMLTPLLPGQIIVDPDHPHWLKRHGGKHVFICGPGDPEDFLYVGRRNPDGTRSGDQVDRINKLVAHGGNCIYMQSVRTHGGDAKADKTQNPFFATRG